LGKLRSHSAQPGEDEEGFISWTGKLPQGGKGLPLGERKKNVLIHEFWEGKLYCIVNWREYGHMEQRWRRRNLFRKGGDPSRTRPIG